MRLSDMQHLGYKVMRYNPETNEIISGADSRVTNGVKLHKGMMLRMPAPGVFMSTNREYVEQYYSGHSDHEALLTLEFDPSKITSGNLTDRENEFTVPTARVVDFEILNHIDENVTESFALDRNRWDDFLESNLAEVQEKMEEVDDMSYELDHDDPGYSEIEKDYRALHAVEMVILNHQKAIKLQDPKHHFLYSINSDDSQFTALHFEINGDVGEIKWIGSYNNPGKAKELMNNAKSMMKSNGVKRIKVTAKWGSEGFYERLNFKRDSNTVDNPLSGSTYTDMSKGVDEAISSINRGKDEKFGINFDILGGTGKLIGKLGQYQVFLETNSFKKSVRVYDPAKDTVAGYIGVKIYDNKNGTSLVTELAAVHPDYEGQGLVLKTYAFLVRKGFTLVSDDIQTAGGKKIWERLARSTGVYVYAVEDFPFPTKFYDVDEFDITDSGIMVYSSDFKKVRELASEFADLDDERNELAGAIEDMEIDRKEGHEIDMEKFREYQDILKQYEYELAAIKKELDAWKKHIKNDQDVRLVATRDKKQTVSEGVGRITKQNQTVDVGPDQVSIEAEKMGLGKIDRDGRPPVLKTGAAKNTTPNRAYNLGLTEMQLACVEGGHSLEDLAVPHKPSKILLAINKEI